MTCAELQDRRERSRRNSKRAIGFEESAGTDQLLSPIHTARVSPLMLTRTKRKPSNHPEDSREYIKFEANEEIGLVEKAPSLSGQSIIVSSARDQITRADSCDALDES